MKSKIVIIILSVLLVVSLLINAVFVYRIYREYRGDITREYMLEAEDMAPDFTVQLLTGDTFTLSEHRGTVVVLDFWATWCGPCVAKMPTVQTLSEQYADRVLFVGMNVGEDPDRVQEFIEERGFTYPIGLDRNSTIHRTLYPSPGIPYTVIINADGMITDTFLGGGADMHGLIEAAIEEALG